MKYKITIDKSYLKTYFDGHTDEHVEEYFKLKSPDMMVSVVFEKPLTFDRLHESTPDIRRAIEDEMGFPLTDDIIILELSCYGKQCDIYLKLSEKDWRKYAEPIVRTQMEKNRKKLLAKGKKTGINNAVVQYTGAGYCLVSKGSTINISAFTHAFTPKSGTMYVIEKLVPDGSSYVASGKVMRAS